jgi:hypothetical protein
MADDIVEATGPYRPQGRFRQQPSPIVAHSHVSDIAQEPPE